MSLSIYNAAVWRELLNCATCPYLSKIVRILSKIAYVIDTQ